MQNDPHSQLVMTAKEESLLRELDGICTDKTAIVSESTNRFSQDHALLAKMKATLNDIRADVKEHGHLTKVHGDIDKHRKTAKGREELNIKRTLERHEKAEAEGRTVRPYVRKPDAAHQVAQRVKARERYDATHDRAAQEKLRRANRTPEQIEIEKQKRREREMRKKLKVLPPRPSGYGDF